MTHIAIVNYACAPDLKDPDALLDRYFSLVSWADGLARAGAQVTVSGLGGSAAALGRMQHNGAKQ